MSFAARALAGKRVSVEGHQEIRLAAQRLKDVVYSAVGTSPEAKRAIRTVRRRRQPKNREISDVLAAAHAKREEAQARRAQAEEVAR
jgi:protein involved in polysaccharide export with SLBB domain